MSSASPPWRSAVWLLFSFFTLFLIPPAQAVNLPQAAVAAQQSQTPAADNKAEDEPSLDEKKSRLCRAGEYSG